jgi:hypothetical protein
MRSLAADIGLSDIAVRKAAIRANLPIPPTGHWNKVLAGKKVLPKPRLPPRGFGAPGEVTFGAEEWSSYPRKSLLEMPMPGEPVFDEALESVRARAAKAVGKITAPRDLKAPHPAVRRLLDDEAERAEKARKTPILASFYAPRFSIPSDYRGLRLLNAIALGLARAGIKSSLWRVGEPAINVGADHCFPVTLQRRSGKGGEVNRLSIIVGVAPDGHGHKFARWDDSDSLKLESALTEIVVEIVTLVESRYRERCVDHYKWALERRDAEIEAARKAKLEAERLERERLAARERARVERLLGEAERLRQADAIRAYVGEVERRASDAIDAEAFERWRTWALEQANRIDPIVNGAFLKTLDELG